MHKGGLNNISGKRLPQAEVPHIICTVVLQVGNG